VGSNGKLGMDAWKKAFAKDCWMKGAKDDNESMAAEQDDSGGMTGDVPGFETSHVPTFSPEDFERLGARKAKGNDDAYRGWTPGGGAPQPITTRSTPAAPKRPEYRGWTPGGGAPMSKDGIVSGIKSAAKSAFAAARKPYPSSTPGDPFHLPSATPKNGFSMRNGRGAHDSPTDKTPDQPSGFDKGGMVRGMDYLKKGQRRLGKAGAMDVILKTKRPSSGVSTSLRHEVEDLQDSV